MTNRGSQARPQRTVAEVLATAADTLVADFDLVTALDDLITDAVDVLGGGLAGMMLASPTGGMFLVASSNEHTDATGLLRLQIYQNGPCVECLDTGRIVSVTGLGGYTERWPSFVTASTALGFHAVHAWPMRLNVQIVGVLNLLRPDPEPLPDSDTALGQAFADLAVISLHQQHCLAREGHLAEQVHSTLSSRVIIEQAKGVLAEEGQIDIRETFAPLRDYARAHHLRLTELARRINADHRQARQVLTAGASA